MPKTDTTYFDIEEEQFAKTISSYSPGEDGAMEILTKRQDQIMAASVSKSQKAEALSSVLWEISRIFPRANTTYCKTLEKHVSVIDSKDQTALLHDAQDAYFHHYNVDFNIYGKILYDIYQKLTPDNKKSYPYINIAKLYRKQQLHNQNLNEKAVIEKKLKLTDAKLVSNNFTTDEKLSMIDEILNTVKEGHFGKIKTNELKKIYCLKAVELCGYDMSHQDTARHYRQQALHFQRLADNARLYTREGNTVANHHKYMQKYRTDRVY